MSFIESLQNPRVKHLVKLRDRKERDLYGHYLIEGFREMTRAIQMGVSFESFFFCPEWFLGSNEGNLIESLTCPKFELSKQAFAKVSYRDRPDGLIAVAKKSPSTLSDLKLSPSPFLVVAESIEKPGNLGSILRSTDGVAADGLLLCDPLTDLYNPNVVRSSVGTCFSVKSVEITSEEAILWLKKQNIKIVAAMPGAKTLYTKADFTQPLALVLGTEQLGLSDVWVEAADEKIFIPMQGIADSLNVSNAATLLLYEVLRQRS